MHDLRRIQRDIIPALRECSPAQDAPAIVEKEISGEYEERFVDSLIDPEVRERLAELVAPLEHGTYLSRDIVGAPEKGTRHAHDFIAEKGDHGTQLFYIDPEHSMGKNKNNNPLGIPRRGDLRPKVNIMYAVQLREDGTIDTISMLRYRASAIPPEQKRLHKNREQFEMARKMFKSGDLPGVLQGKEHEITFRFDFRKEEDGHAKVAVQARQAESTEAVENMIDSVMNGKPMPAHDPMGGHLERFRSIMRTHFPRHLEAGNFKSVEGIANNSGQ